MSEDNKPLAEVITYDSSSKTLAVVLDQDSFYIKYTFRRYNDKGELKTSNAIEPVLSRPLFVRKLVRIEDRELIVADYGDVELTGNAEDIIAGIRKVGGVMSNKYRTAVSTILEAQRGRASYETAFPCVGVFQDPDKGELCLALPQNNNIYLTQNRENEEANMITTELKKAKLLPKFDPLFKEALEGYVALSKYAKPLDLVPIMYASTSALAYELKAVVTGDYFCQVLLHGPPGTAKSTYANIATQDLYGIQPKGKDAVDSPFRLLQILNATTMAQHIAEMETFDFDEFGDTIKNGTDIRNIGTRGNFDQSLNNYFGKSTLFYSANGYKATKPALLKRLLLIPAQRTQEEAAQTAELFELHVRQKTRSFPVGYELLQSVIGSEATGRTKDINTIAQEILNVKSEILKAIRKPDVAIELTDLRRCLTYALILYGVRAWQRFIHSVMPETATNLDHWFNRLAKLDIFCHEIIRPLEQSSAETLEQVPVAAFIAWLQSWTANEGDREEGHTWMRAHDRDYIYVTSSVLQKHKEHIKRAGGAAFESLPQLATELKAHIGEDCKPYPHDIGLEEQRDSDNRIVKRPVPFHKCKVVRVPLHGQTKLQRGEKENEKLPCAYCEYVSESKDAYERHVVQEHKGFPAYPQKS